MMKREQIQWSRFSPKSQNAFFTTLGCLVAFKSIQKFIPQDYMQYDFKVWWSLYSSHQHGQWQDLHLPLVLASDPPHHLPSLLSVQVGHRVQPQRQDVPARHTRPQPPRQDSGVSTERPRLRGLAHPLHDGGSSWHQDVQWYPSTNKDCQHWRKTTFVNKVAKLKCFTLLFEEILSTATMTSTVELNGASDTEGEENEVKEPLRASPLVTPASARKISAPILKKVFHISIYAYIQEKWIICRAQQQLIWLNSLEWIMTL